ncbi:MAG TPA: hypothetical protein VGO97_02225 [Solirubrobacterales bacterium]|jgi:hypothetical protein|nr:hypothetical protein [Solirubrobacterales bacterium]
MKRSSILRFQSAYYGLTGVWPLISIETFERITGPKLERWLVRTVGAVVGVQGAGFWIAAHEREATRSTAVIAAGSALALGAIDGVYVAKRRISPVYLVDAVIQSVFVVAWLTALREGRRPRLEAPPA